jgi:hypothetical protein
MAGYPGCKQAYTLTCLQIRAAMTKRLDKHEGVT